MKQCFYAILLTVTLTYASDTISGEDYPEAPAGQGSSQTIEQREINKNTLLENKDEQMRAGAAYILLTDTNPAARQIIIETLKLEKNSPARVAICRALGRFRTEKKEISSGEEFITPLLSMLTTSEEAQEVRQAAEALLIFKYDDIATQLEKVVTDRNSPVKARLGGVYAMQLQPDMRATIQLIKLVDDADKQVSAEAEKVLRSIGIPAGKDKETRKEIIKELEGKGRNKFLQDWLIRQESSITRLETKVKLWRERYLASLDKIYGGITDDTEKGKFLSGFLGDSESVVKLWALDKVYKWWVGTAPKSGMLSELKPALLTAIADGDRDVRLKAAMLLSLIGELDSASALAEQYKVEPDGEVKAAVLDALGWAVYYGSLPNATVKVSPELKKQTLKWAEVYLADADSVKAQKGVDVIKKLLEQDGLTGEEANKYLGLLAAKYGQTKNPTGEKLSAEVLGAMSDLCGNSVYKERAVQTYRGIFEESLKSPADVIRQTAVEGLINIDKATALKMLRKDFVNDKNAAIREKLIELADSTGTKDDLNWLSEKIGADTEGKSAWQAMLKIFKRCETGILIEWYSRLAAKNSEEKLADEQFLSFLETAEPKASADKNVKILQDIHTTMAGVYRKVGNFEQTAKFLGLLLQNPRSAREKEILLSELLEAYLRWPNIARAKELVHNCLLERDLAPDDPIITTIETLITAAPADVDANSIIGSLGTIQAPDARPMWAAQIRKWSVQIAKASDANKPQTK